MGFMWSDSIVKSALNLMRTEKDLSTMTILQKIIYLKNYSKEVHRTNRDDIFYFCSVKPHSVLSNYSDTKFNFYRKKQNIYLCRSFTTTEIRLILLNNFILQVNLIQQIKQDYLGFLPCLAENFMSIEQKLWQLLINLLEQKIMIAIFLISTLHLRDVQ